MKKRINDKSKCNQQEKMIEQTLKTSGFLFPETVEEVKEFERIYGSTDVILPAELHEPTFLYTKSGIGNSSKVVKFPSANFAMAAREGKSDLPNEIQQKIIKDIKDAERKIKKKKM
ncbi:MAG: hypothetical protein Q8K70_03430 [Bacteroidota bacterium]|nr:hypothetical protein [Bacteroidota bacterium]